jgi:hypothetical protein
MKETPEDLKNLQDLLDESIERAGAFLRNSFEMPELSLSAGELVEVLHGSLTVAFSTITARDEPRVAPVGASSTGAASTFPPWPTPRGPGTSERGRR